MRKLYIIILLCWGVGIYAQPIPDDEMRAIYEEVKTPYKYGMVIAPTDNYHKIDCPTVFRERDKWYMTYVIYNGKDGTDGRGYETWLSESDDLLHWKTLGRILSFKDSGWDMNQRGGFPSLIDWTWGGTYEMRKYRGRHWMTYIGGDGTGYEAVQKPLNIGIAWTKGDIAKAHEWDSADKPLLSIEDRDAQWWEKLVQYKSTVYEDKSRRLGKRFVMFYNAGGISPANRMKAERIGIALSNDLKKWRRYPQNPVYFHEASGIITGDAQIVRMGDKFVLFYFSAYNPSRKYDAFNTFSVSRDLIHWQDWNGDDLIRPSKDYDNLFAHKSYVLKHAGVVYHFYCAVNRTGQRGIAVATNVPIGRSAVRFPEPEAQGVRKIIELNDRWSARVLQANQKLAYHEDELHNVNLPHNFDSYYGYRQLRHGNLHGTALYEKEFILSKTDGKRYFLQFEGIGTYATITLNGHTYPRTGVGRTTYTLDVTTALLNGDNRLTVRCEHPEMITDMPWVCGGCSAEWGFSEGSQPFGIFRPVSLIETAEVCVEPFGVHVWNNAACDSVFIETEVRNYSTRPMAVEVVSKMNLKSGKQFFRLSTPVTLDPGEVRTIRQQTAISNPHLWNLDDPYLYSLASMLKDSQGHTVDQVTTAFGIRSVSWPLHRKDGDHRFLLNGQPVFINGTCEYEHLFGQSHAFSREQIASRVKMMRQTGFNAFREAHQPHNLYYQQLMDEQGMLFWSQFSAHIWYDTPLFREHFKQHLRQWIKERRNSPSIMLWGLQNESVLPKDFAEECSQIIREMDPTCVDQRAITTCNDGEGTDWNVVQNWSGTYGGNVYNYDRELKQPTQLLNGEYGAWRTLGLHDGSKYSETSFADLLMTKALKAESVRDSVCGHFQWCFLSHDNPGRVQPDESIRCIDKVGPFNYKGIFTIWEQPTEVFYRYRNHYADSTKDTITPTAASRNRDIVKAAPGYNYLYRLNCGGDRYVDSYGQTWLQDDSTFSESWSRPFGLNPYLASQGHLTDDIQGTADDPLFQYFRWGKHQLKYHFTVPDDGEYRVELYFAEPWLGARYGAAIDCEGERIFDGAINDSVVMDDFDPWAEAGYAGACKRTFYIKTRNRQIDISFPETKVGEAVIAAIAIGTKSRSEGDYAAMPSKMRKDFWALQDTDTVAKYPKALLPTDVEAFPSVRYKETGKHVWTVNPGVARDYMIRFRYKNITGTAVRGRLLIVDSKRTVLANRAMTFPVTPNKFKTIGTTVGTQINAGQYQLTVRDAAGIDFDYIELQ